MSKEKTREKITEILVMSQFAHWVDCKCKTAEEINTQAERAIQYYLGNVKEDKLLATNRFRALIQSQTAHIEQALKEDE